MGLFQKISDWVNNILWVDFESYAQRNPHVFEPVDAYKEKPKKVAKPTVKDEEPIPPVNIEKENNEVAKTTTIRMAVVCVECHEKDRPATGCEKPITEHPHSIRHNQKCGICGKKADTLIFCRKYLEMSRSSFKFDSEE